MKRFILVAFSGLALAGCSDDNCRQMKACCAAVQDVEWVGESCGELAKDVRDPKTCHTILETIRHAYAQKGEQLPLECGATK